jgi:hypothetical protein
MAYKYFKRPQEITDKRINLIVFKLPASHGNLKGGHTDQNGRNLSLDYKENLEAFPNSLPEGF